MKLFASAFACLALSCSSVLADCAGRDLRAFLTPDERATIETRLAATPFPQGNHWIARKDTRTIHVIGTLHLDDPRMDAIVAGFEPLIANAGLMMVEATRVEQDRLEQAMTRRPELIFLQSGPTLPDLLEEDTWTELQELAAARGLPGFMVAKMQPWYLSLLLAIPACAMAGLQEGEEGLDGRLMDIAAEQGVPMRALEPYDTVFRLMGVDPLEQQVEMLTLGILPERVLEDLHRTMTNSYFDENAAEIFELNRTVVRDHVDLDDAGFDALMDKFLRELLDDRNRDWMPAILDAPPGLSVVAVGAGHLPGTSGLLQLLSEAGYELERADF